MGAGGHQGNGEEYGMIFAFLFDRGGRLTLHVNIGNVNLQSEKGGMLYEKI